MKLDAVIIDGFRGYAQKYLIPISQLTAFIGRNDIGKSTILEALDAFFNDEVDSQDLNTGINRKTFTIGCIFSTLPDTISLDATSATSLAQEYLLNGDSKLEIYKTWKCTATKAEVERIFARAHAPTNEQVKDLLFKNRDELREMLDGLNIEANRNLNADMRRVIYNHFAARDQLALQDRDVDLDRPKEKSDGLEDARKIWKKLHDRYLPVYTLFKSEQVRGDKETAVRSPLDSTLKAAIKALDQALGPITAQVEAAVRETTERTLRRLQKDYPDIARNLVPEYKAPTWSKAFDLEVLRGDDNVPLNKRGAGVRRLVVLAFFQAEAEKRRSERGGENTAPPIIYAIEEPETSQHPDFQRNIIRAFEDVAEAGDQVLLTTHVPGVAALLPIASVRFVTRAENGAVQILGGNDDVYERVAETLGLMPDRRAKVAFFVEGPNDVEFFQRAADLYRTADATVPDLKTDHRIAFVPTGGGNLQHWIDKRYLARARFVEVHVFDRDDQNAPKYQQQINDVNARGNSDVGYLTSKRELENYLHCDAVAQVLGCQIAITDWCDVPDLVAEQVHIAGGGHGAWATLDEEKRRKKQSQAKRRLNTDVISQMTLPQLQQRDANNDILNWLHAIRDRLED